MRVWGAILDPHRDLGPLMPACSKPSVVNTLRSSLYGDGVFLKSQQATGSVADLAQVAGPPRTLKYECVAPLWAHIAILGVYPPHAVRLVSWRP